MLTVKSLMKLSLKKLPHRLVTTPILAKVCNKFWVTESKNDLVIKKLKSDCEVPSKCEKFYSLNLNKEILKNRNIHSYYKRSDRKWLIFNTLKIIDSCHEHCQHLSGHR